jgi:hypothetical protein
MVQVPPAHVSPAQQSPTLQGVPACEHSQRLPVQVPLQHVPVMQLAA